MTYLLLVLVNHLYCSKKLEKKLCCSEKLEKLYSKKLENNYIVAKNCFKFKGRFLIALGKIAMPSLHLFHLGNRTLYCLLSLFAFDNYHDSLVSRNYVT